MTNKLSQTNLKKIIVTLLDDNRAQDIVVLDVRKLTDIANYIIIGTGNSHTHVGALADKLVREISNYKIKPLGVEGTDTREWVLVDFGAILINIMLQETRNFYQLEKLWELNS